MSCTFAIRRQQIAHLRLQRNIILVISTTCLGYYVYAWLQIDSADGEMIIDNIIIIDILPLFYPT